MSLLRNQNEKVNSNKRLENLVETMEYVACSHLHFFFNVHTRASGGY